MHQILHKQLQQLQKQDLKQKTLSKKRRLSEFFFFENYS
jgi:hypothetical protein